MCYTYRINKLGSDLLTRLKNAVATVILGIFTAIFLWILANGFLAFDPVSYAFNPFLVMGGTALFVVAALVFRKIIAPKLENIRWLPYILLGIFAVFSFTVGILMRVNPSWDMGDVFHIAKSLAGGGYMETYYLYYYPNNVVICAVYIVVFKIAMLLGFTDLVLVATVFNALLVSLTAVCTYFAARHLYGKATSLTLLAVMVLTTPIYLQAAIYYTDSASMFAVSLVVLLILKTVDAKTTRSSVILQILTGFSAFSAFGIKVTAFIPVIAFIIYAIYRGFGLKDLKKMAVAVLTFLVVFIGFTAAKNAFFDSELIERYQYPPEHWIMMGLTPSDGFSVAGGFSIEDCIYTSSFKTMAERKEATRAKIVERFSQYNANTYLKHLTKKMKFAWTDGVFFAPEKLRREPVKHTFLHECVLYDGEYTDIYKYFPQCMHMGMLFFMIYAAFCQTKRQGKKSVEAALILAVFGMLIFFAIWENRSRYILTILPVMLLLEANGIDLLLEKLRKNKEKES